MADQKVGFQRAIQIKTARRTPYAVKGYEDSNVEANAEAERRMRAAAAASQSAPAAPVGGPPSTWSDRAVEAGKGLIGFFKTLPKQLQGAAGK